MNYTYKQIWLINFPVMMSILMEQLINITDAIFLGHVGEVELGASALAGIYYLAVYMLGFGFSIGLHVMIAGNATKIGNGNYLMDKVHLCHDVQINNNCVVGIGSTIAGECTLDDCVILSGNVTLHQYCHIGSWTLVQSGCRISKDVPPYVIMSGNPVAYHGVNAVVLSQHHNTSERVLRHIANAYRLIYQGNFSVQDAVQKIIDQVPMSEEIENIVNFVKNSERGIVK